MRTVMSRSRSTRGTMPGRWILTATASPECSCARWTCPIEAAASGVVSNSANAASTSWPSSLSISAWTSLQGSGGTDCWSLESSVMYSAGSSSARVESTCPNFTNVTPESCSARRSDLPLAARSAAAAGVAPLLGRLAGRIPWDRAMRVTSVYLRVRANRARSEAIHLSGRTTVPVGKTSSATTRNRVATISTMPICTGSRAMPGLRVLPHEPGLESDLGPQAQQAGDDDAAQADGHAQQPPDEHRQDDDVNDRDHGREQDAPEYVCKLHAILTNQAHASSRSVR